MESTVTSSLGAADQTSREARNRYPHIARDLAEIASHIAQIKGDARACFSDPNYNTLELRLEAAHSAVEAAAVEATRSGR